ncbi:hypothetical protein AX16_003893 [Volvariella volvacea WC 439]|nr:hypothetical protein AX16_003893 [Volvariella volvacea WC 439]
MYKKVLGGGLLALAYSSRTLAATADEWRGRSIYQVLTDRFATTDDQSASCNTTERLYCGGTWRGIINHLDYIREMGFDAVWISPIVANVEGQTPYGEAYHGYWTSDINSLNSHYGTQDDLKALSDALHEKDMFLMVDVVVNHYGALGNELTVDYSSYIPFSSPADFHPPCPMTNFTNQTEMELCWIGDDQLRLPDLNTESDSVVQTFNEWIGGLVDEYDIDGLRIDTLKHVRIDFWPEFARSADVYTIGEVLSDDVTYTANYTNVIDAVLDYPTWFPLVSAFTNPQGNLSALRDFATRAQGSYRNGAFTAGSFLENHDQPRFQSVTQDQSLVQNAIAWTFVNDGIPIVYYGQEHGYSGAHDPDNREALWFTSYQTSDKPLVSHIKSLNGARKAASSANRDFLTTAARFIDQSNNATLVIAKAPLLALLTNAGNSSSGTTWQVAASDLPFGSSDTIVNVLTCDTVARQSDGSISVESNSGLPQVLLPASALDRNGQLCPQVGTGSGSSNNDTNNARSFLSSSVIYNTFLAATGTSILAALLPAGIF